MLNEFELIDFIWNIQMSERQGSFMWVLILYVVPPQRILVL